MTTAAILLAGGSGSRVRRDVNKVYLAVGERPLLSYSLETLLSSPLVAEVTLVVRPEDHERAAEVLAVTTGGDRVAALVSGGPTRHASELSGLESVAPRIARGEVDLVVIHDGARPFLTHTLLAAVIEAARRHGGAVPALTVGEPLHRDTARGLHPVDSSSLRRIQTPQAFRAAPLLDAYRAAGAASFEGVDTAETVERFSNLEVAAVPGDERNLKVTYVEDLFVAEDLAPAWKSGAWLRSSFP